MGGFQGWGGEGANGADDDLYSYAFDGLNFWTGTLASSRIMSSDVGGGVECVAEDDLYSYAFDGLNFWTGTLAGVGFFTCGGGFPGGGGGGTLGGQRGRQRPLLVLL